jgi:two-component system sensor histidine kinase/response regulator
MATAPHRTLTGSSKPSVAPRLAVLASFGVAAVAVVVLFSWWFHLPARSGEHVPMKPNTALGLLFAAAAVVALARGASTLRLAGALAAAPVAIGLITCAEYLLSLGGSFDGFLVSRQATGARMTPASALSLILEGGALAIASRPARRGILASQALALLGMISPFVAVVGYLYGVHELFGVASFTHMALHTALAFVTIGFGIFAAQPHVGLGALVTGDTAGGLLARRMLFASVFVPLVGGWIRQWGQRQGYYDTSMGLALFATTNVVVFATLVLICARLLNRQQGQRQRAEGEILQLNARLEETVEARTAELTRANAELQREVAERTRYQEAHRRSETRYRSMVRSIPNATLVLFDKDLRFLAAEGTDQLESVGRSYVDWVGKTLQEVASPESLHEIEPAYRAALEGKQVNQELQRYGHWFSYHTGPVHDENGAIIGGLAFFHDIGALKQAESVLRENEARFRGLAEATFEGIAIVDGDRIVEVNAALAAMYGQRREVLVGKSAADLIAPAEREAVLAHLAGGSPDARESMAARGDGTCFPVEIRGRPIDLGGRPLRAVAVHDLTERRRNQEALRRSENQFRALVEGLPDMVLVIRGGRFVYVNRASVDTMGYSSAEELLAMNPLDLVRPEHAAKVSRDLKQTTPEARFSETRAMHKKGHTLLIEAMTIGTHYEGGPALLTIARDVTGRRKAEDAARRATLLWRAILDGSPHSIIATTPDGIIREFNPAAERMLGYRAAEVIGKFTPALIHHPAEIASRAEVLTRELDVKINPGFEVLVARARRGLRDENDWTYVRRDGSRFAVRLSMSALRDSAGTITGFLGMASDITESKRDQEELVSAKEAAVQAMRARADFLARMSHEIRTPMNGVIGMTELCLQSRLTAEQRDYLDTALASARSLLALVNDILDFSKIDAGKLRLEAISFRPRDLIGSSLRALSRQAHDKKVELIFDVALDVPHGLIGDPLRLQQVVTNLAGNAVKFTDRGEIVVHVSVVGRREGEVDLQIDITDTGIGIPPEKQAAIFEAFSQANEATTRTFGGTGLGLAICAQLIDLMRGKMWVESELGKGSRFSFSVPLPIDQTIDAKRADPSLRSLRVLVVDNHHRQRAVLRAMLESWRFEAVEAMGADALVMARAARDEGRPFQVALLDGELPDVNTLELGGQLRQLSPTTSLVLVASAGQVVDARREALLGTLGHISKPVLASTLLETIQAVVSGGAAMVMGHNTGFHAPLLGRFLKILVAEDNPVNRKVVTRMLGKMGHQVTAVEDGRQALAAAAAGDFDLALMDVQMPQMDGFEATRVLRASEAHGGRRLPVIALTAQAMQGDRELCLAAGMDGYVTKPIAREELIAAMDRALADPQDPAAAPPPAAAGPPDDAFNRAELLDRTDGDASLLNELVSLFLAELPNSVSVLERAVAAEDPVAVARAAHSLKGALLNLAAHPASALARDLEDRSRRNDLNHARETFANLQEELSRLRASLESPG